MILFIILSIIALVLTLFVAIAVIFGGSAFIIVFGDVIICIVIIVSIVKRKIKKRNKTKKD